MAKRALKKNKKIQIVAVLSALATGGAIVSLLPSANAADTATKTPEQIMRMCEKARVINGEQQSFPGISNTPLADSCDFMETDFETFSGEPQQATIEFPNCEPNAKKPSSATKKGSAIVTQGEGKYTVTQQGGGGGLFGVLNLSWTKHQATTDMTTKTVIASVGDTPQVPVGKVLFMQFTPRMQRMTGVWRVKIDARPPTTTTNAVPEQIFEAPEVVEGPAILPGAAGAPGLADGVTKPIISDC
ncbi:hypothetical protein [Streptomyces europaeiscabiei]|uniref:hypothetical protein n=1 Tax=Streptomyces europaeiscabiei TaxID=146819 RepID=UPI002E19C6A9